MDRLERILALPNSAELGEEGAAAELLDVGPRHVPTFFESFDALQI